MSEFKLKNFLSGDFKVWESYQVLKTSRIAIFHSFNKYSLKTFYVTDITVETKSPSLHSSKDRK